jgi:chloramphenicol-sensitive protein RarD
MEASATAERAAAESYRAVGAGLACYTIWGFIPLLFQLLGHRGAGAVEIMAHRIVWGALSAGVLLLAGRQARELAKVLRKPRVLAWLGLSAVLIAANWTLFVWSVNHGRLLETSLGYYIIPLFNMAFGALLFQERIGRIGQVAVVLAVIGVAIQALALGHLPYIALVLTLTFGGYGVVRKRVAAEATVGLFVECLILLIPALVFVGWLQATGRGHFADPQTAFWLVVGGPATAAPLALFAWAARRMPLSSLGFLQFVGPTISFFIGMAEGEPFTLVRAASFAFIWAGAAVFVYGAWRKTRGVRLAVPPAASPAGQA